ncbi:hypothetical protein [Gimesia aquarii]|uniref:Uncharacterized protein n=1 Tax=Gimesia aquarii TaxID=2527964 RepID=A0A517VRB0_9PLAN|nr:hypothetical protein [Gimesia aquarii]QDT95543.1 hypothetical protein V144x_09880 [Gimesia aquarii]
MTTWQYADYMSEPDVSSRLSRLRLHIQEVAQRTVAIEGRSKNVSAVDAQYLNSLRSEEKQLTEVVDAAQYSTFRRNHVTFRRD